jgi:hypothetical protein
MRRCILLVLAIAMSTPLAAAELPDAAALPSRPELPDPLVMLNGDKITTKEAWQSKRRPELKTLFQHYMYGYFPDAPKEVTGKIEREDPKYFGGKATKKEVTISFGPEAMPKIHLLLVIPNTRKKPAPCFVGMNFCGNHALVKDPTILLPTVWMYPNRPGVTDNRATEAGRGTDVDVWALEQSIDRGYAVATFYNGDIKPDHPKYTDGIQKHFFKEGQTEPGPREWGVIASWAWGISRAVDYLVTDKDIDRTKIAAVGHSRLGKTALLAAAFDERIALAIPLQAGCGGTAPSRGKVGESVQRINTSFPHWFNGEFKKFNEHPDRLPFDQHCLVALCAPRPVLFANAVEDTWANPDGQFEMLKAADPVYRLLGAGGLDAKKMPEVNALVDSTLGYYIRPGKHSMRKSDWKVFLDFADKHFGKPEAK